MKKNILIMILSVVFFLIIFACSPQVSPDPPSSSETTNIDSDVGETSGKETDPPESLPDSSKWEYDEVEEYQIAKGLGEPPYMRWYPSNLYSVEFAYEFADSEEVNAIFDSWEGNLELYQYPSSYTIIKQLSISKDELMQVEPNLSPEQIEIFYSGCSDGELKQKLKADHIFYYDGWIYNIYDLAELERGKLQEISANSNLAEFVESFWDRYGARKDIKIINALATITEKIVG